MKSRLRIALLCWAIPLVLGSVNFACWLATDEPALMFAGLGVIGLGCLLFVVGMIALVFDWRSSHSDTDKGNSKKNCFRTGALLLSNFPVALGLTFAAISWECRYEIIIHNNSMQTLKDMRIIGGGCDAQVEELAPGKTVSKTFWILTDGTLILEAKTPNKTIQIQVDDYVTKGLGGRSRVGFLPDQTVEIENQYPK